MLLEPKALIVRLSCSIRAYWNDTVKIDLVNMFNERFNGNINIFIKFCIDYISRIMKMFMPISLLNCRFNTLPKLSQIDLLWLLIDWLPFIRWRFILETVVTAHDIIPEIHRSKEKGLLLRDTLKIITTFGP